MLRNYIKIAWRNLLKNPVFTTINILGLFTGISFLLLIGAYIWQETQINKKLKNADRQYLLTSKWDEVDKWPSFTTFGPLAKALQEEYPHLVANYYRWDGINVEIAAGDQKFREGVLLGDSTLIQQFGFDLLYGDPKQVFAQPYAVVLKKKQAIKYFGRPDVIGETLSIQNFSGENRAFKITGVLNPQGENSVTHLNDSNDNGIFISFNTADFFNRLDFKGWEIPIFPSYVELKSGVSPEDLKLPIQKLLKTHTDKEVYQSLEILPVALNQYYLERDNGLVKNMLTTLGLVGLFILIMAIMNFINLTINQSAGRMREIGVRKVMGGNRKQLIRQFLVESLTLTSLATVSAVAAYPLLRSWFSVLIGKEIAPLYSFSFYFILIPFVLALFIGVFAGAYPAFFLSSFNLIQALKGKLKINGSGVLFRQLLLGFQYAIALVVLIGTLVITQQVDFFFSKDLGYTKDFLVTCPVPRDWSERGTKKMANARDVFLKLPEVESASFSYEIPNGNNGFQVAILKSGTNPQTAQVTQAFVTDENFLNSYKIPLVTGSFFQKSDSDANAVVINATAANAYGFESPREAVGEKIRIKEETQPLTIVGVVLDFHFNSLHQVVPPQVFFNANSLNTYRYLTFRIQSENIAKGLSVIQKQWAVTFPDSSFNYQFIDQMLEHMYATELRLQKSAYTATVLALVMVFLGVFGLVSLSIKTRIKEIGIRKVLGASLQHIIYLFSKQFLIASALATFLACPIAYLIITNWLDRYAYRIVVDIWPFAIAVGVLIATSLALIVLQTVRVTTNNLIKSLKSE